MEINLQHNNAMDDNCWLELEAKNSEAQPKMVQSKMVHSKWDLAIQMEKFRISSITMIFNSELLSFLMQKILNPSQQLAHKDSALILESLHSELESSIDWPPVADCKLNGLWITANGTHSELAKFVKSMQKPTGDCFVVYSKWQEAGCFIFLWSVLIIDSLMTHLILLPFAPSCMILSWHIALKPINKKVPLSIRSKAMTLLFNNWVPTEQEALDWCDAKPITKVRKEVVGIEYWKQSWDCTFICTIKSQQMSWQLESIECTKALEKVL